MISLEQVQHIAKLARIQLKEEEMQKFQADLAAVLDYFNLVNEVDVSKVDPMTHSVSLENVKRKDEAQKSKTAVQLVEMAPGQQDGFLKVKSIL